MLTPSKDMIKGFSTKDLKEELDRRKLEDVEHIVNDINKGIETLKCLGVVVITDDRYDIVNCIEVGDDIDRVFARTRP